jgi:hypothetical protein
MTCSCSAFKKTNLILTDEEKKIEDEKKSKAMTIERYINISVGSAWFWVCIAVVCVFVIIAIILCFK